MLLLAPYILHIRLGCIELSACAHVLIPLEKTMKELCVLIHTPQQVTYNGNCLEKNIHLPMLALTHMIAIRCIPAAIELRFGKTICTPLLSLCILNRTNAHQFTLFSYFIDDTLTILFRTFLHFG